jgi:hypothetical protein
VLRRFAAELVPLLGPGDVLARWGGEFVLLLARPDANQAAQWLERLRQHVESLSVVLPDGHVLRFTASFGLTEHRWPEDPSETVARADAALYQARPRGATGGAGTARRTGGRLRVIARTGRRRGRAAARCAATAVLQRRLRRRPHPAAARVGGHGARCLRALNFQKVRLKQFKCRISANFHASNRLSDKRPLVGDSESQKSGKGM